MAKSAKLASVAPEFNRCVVFKHWTNLLEDLGACDAAVAWARDYDSLDAAWAACARGDWMLWLLARVAQQGSPEHRAAVATACACARRALRVRPSELQPARHAIELAERWAQGDPAVSLDDLCQARRAAYAAAAAATYGADAADAAAAAYAAAYAAYAAYAAAAAAAADAAAAAAADAAYVAADADAAKAELAAIADLIRGRHVAPDITRIACMQD